MEARHEQEVNALKAKQAPAEAGEASPEGIDAATPKEAIEQAAEDAVAVDSAVVAEPSATSEEAQPEKKKSRAQKRRVRATDCLIR